MDNSNGYKNGSDVRPGSRDATSGIIRVGVSGFKSIASKQSIDIRPLTVLAGPNSSGKSSIMQPLLLLKQTLDCPYDPGALRLNGPNARFTALGQIQPHGLPAEEWKIGISITAGHAHYSSVDIEFKPTNSRAFELSKMTTHRRKDVFSLAATSTIGDLEAQLPGTVASYSESFGANEIALAVERRRCFYHAELFGYSQGGGRTSVVFTLEEYLSDCLQEAIHLPGLRGNPERTYPLTASGPLFPGVFVEYTASVVAQWQRDQAIDKLAAIGEQMLSLGLGNQVKATSINDTEVELRVSRSVDSGIDDMVSVADVGLGVSQTLPLLVALQAAVPGQLVYIEQPEIHLHPRAQRALANVLAGAATRGVRIVAETHSSLLLQGVQTLVAKGELDPALAKLHWFERDGEGHTQISSHDLDETGAFGDWPEDFDDVALDSEAEYIRAAGTRARAGTA